jgi:hypothetical protein
MGGHVHYIISSDIECEGPFDIGKGLFAYTATSPAGIQFVVDSVSLGVVGNSLDAVRKDVEEGELDVMHQQQRDALARFKAKLAAGAVEVREPGYFWAKIGGI